MNSREGGKARASVEKRRITGARERSRAVCVFTERQRETATRDSEKRMNTTVNSEALCPASCVESPRIASCRVATRGAVFMVA